jgi:hypothetical protein
LSKFFRALAFLVAVCCLTWLGVLWWWQRTGYDAEAPDLVLFLGLLPLALTLAFIGTRWAWRRRAASGGVGGAAAVATSTAGGAGNDASGAEEQARHAVVQLVLAHAHTVAGEACADVLEAAGSGKPLPCPDATLANNDGLPVMSARIADKGLSLDAVLSELTALLPAVSRQFDGDLSEPSEHVVRALAALKPPLEAQIDCLWELHQAQRLALEEAGGTNDELPPGQRPPLPGLRVLLGWPAHWSARDQALARAWTDSLMLMEQCSLKDGYTLSVTSLAGSGEELWLRADLMSHSSAASPWLLVAACDSALSQERVDALAGAQRLYEASTCPGGRMPGEGAAALLLAPAQWRPVGDVEVETVLLHRPALLRRDKPIESSGRVGHGELAQVLEQALAAAKVAHAELSTVVCDADLHSQRGVELYGMAVEALGHLDPMEDIRLLGKVTGDTGVASVLVVLAAAAESVKATKKPTLALGMGDSQLRMALVLQPQTQDDGAT